MNTMAKIVATSPSQDRKPPIAIGEAVALLLTELEADDLIFIAHDEVRASAIASAMKAASDWHSVIFCPGSDALPGDTGAASPANAGQRTNALRTLRLRQQEDQSGHIALITTGESCAWLFPQPEAYDPAPPILHCGDAIDFTTFAVTLEELGYFRDERVDEPGEFAVRGLVIDIYPADAAGPYRIEASGDKIASIRAYDPISQLTTEDCDTLEIGRAREPEAGDGVTLVDHLPKARIFQDKGADKRRRVFVQLAADTAQRAGRAAMRQICSDERWHASTASHPDKALAGDIGDAPARFAEQGDPMRAFAKAAREALKGGKVLLVGSPRDLRFLTPRIAAKLKEDVQSITAWREALEAPQGALLSLAMPLPRGFRSADMLVVSAADLLGSRAQRDLGDTDHAQIDPFQLTELRRGDVVVHEDHGLSVIEGLDAAPEGGEAIVLRFAGETRRLIPAAEASRIWRYGSDVDAVKLDKLDGSSWAKRRGDVDATLAEAARELTELAAERLKRDAAVIEPDVPAYEQFAESFAFTETADQARAIAAVRADLAAGKPMDRLIVGDVGFGKTEVALRAAAMVAIAGKQVAIVAPTTVLVRQHIETFTKRFQELGITVAGLSRLSTAAEKKSVKAGLADGSIAIVIGTGAVAGKGVVFHDLGLVIIDEEQRFGAADKAKIAALGADHVLTLSATPIPRTLQSALVGLRQLSVIATPPARRQPIRSTVGPFDEAQVRAALLREHSRAGQSFLVVPRVEDLAGLATRLKRLVPELSVLQAHGKMPAAELDETMVRFANGDGDVLLATNIIEAGLDVPRANTMVVWRADRFGLAQLHQLRGRVGRGSRRGHIMLTTEPDAKIAPRTLARLNTLAAFDRLGAGFAISARDLDMRGAGDLLGEEQAGHAKLIGIELYQHMMRLSIAKARGEDVDEWQPVLHAGSPGLLPEDWIPDEDLRITLYARLSRIADLGALEAFEAEVQDRFGVLPAEAVQLLAMARLRILARKGHIDRIDAGPAAIALTPRRGHADAVKALKLVRSEERYLLKGDFHDEADRLAKAEDLLSNLA
ncbi:helicase-related protein [Novosphingobium fluoreni]|uniref:helicase-related protein n=1 Tax=Novosphingobium fluoreni TaxID=1391222 RepID=UPI003DA1BC86